MSPRSPMSPIGTILPPLSKQKTPERRCAPEFWGREKSRDLLCRLCCELGKIGLDRFVLVKVEFAVHTVTDALHTSG